MSMQSIAGSNPLAIRSTVKDKPSGSPVGGSRIEKQSEAELKLHVGCGTRAIPGYVNIDIQTAPGVDELADLRDLPVDDNTVDLIYSCANIEHFGRRQWKGVIAHWYAKLRPGGVLRLSTADFRAAVDRYLEVGNIEELLGLVVGGQKDPYDWHGMIFDFPFLKRGLEEVGFTNVRRYDWRQTELVTLNIDDYSQAYLPHMDKDHGRLMMLNVLADKPVTAARHSAA